MSSRAPIRPLPNVRPMRRASLQPSSSSFLSSTKPSPTMASYSGYSFTAFCMARFRVRDIALFLREGSSVSSSCSSHFVRIRV